MRPQKYHGKSVAYGPRPNWPKHKENEIHLDYQERGEYVGEIPYQEYFQTYSLFDIALGHGLSVHHHNNFEKLWDLVWRHSLGPIRILRFTKQGIHNFVPTPSFEVKLPVIDSIHAQSRQNTYYHENDTWFRYNGHVYNPSSLYVIYHDTKGLRILPWGPRKHPKPNPDYQFCKNKHNVTGNCELRTIVPASSFCIGLQGKQATTYVFPQEYRQPKGKRAPLKKSQRRRCQHILIVKEPEHIPFVRTFNLQYYHPVLHSWLMLQNDVPGNQTAADQKYWYFETPVPTTRLRFYPVTYHETPTYQLDLYVKEEAPVEPIQIKHHVYTINMPPPTEFKNKKLKTGRSEERQRNYSWKPNIRKRGSRSHRRMQMLRQEEKE